MTWSVDIGGRGDSHARPITLEEMLAAREARVERQGAMLARFHRPLVSLTLVMPGAVKNPPFATPLLAAAIEQVRAAARGCGWTILAEERIAAGTGPEALVVIDAEAADIKRAMTAIEETHELGRLWDLDVIALGELSISRRALGLPVRRCLVCGEAAHVCARSRRHPVEELFSIVAEKAHASLGFGGD
ncbi:citrate lyase holo-[acyl-carrier protein] synthase [Consotaella salsifontis]|uniref:citrate lyase holo-[acyl-carrier protein] synthase n=1 Tax=Consotaella salsifontis TaxID=1365950 RepID=A0A1T4MRJ0_9HYPH|nr:citrate lyase holo-[acyl-carrier protein] synthase [Consotaella salsifontis]SJZ69447.1 holo-ACP synthase [Consotaella salsifontis]